MNNKLSFTLRPWRPEDAAAIVPYADDPLVAENLRDVFPNPYPQVFFLFFDFTRLPFILSCPISTLTAMQPNG